MLSFLTEQNKFKLKGTKNLGSSINLTLSIRVFAAQLIKLISIDENIDDGKMEDMSAGNLC